MRSARARGDSVSWQQVSSGEEPEDPAGVNEDGHRAAAHAAGANRRDRSRHPLGGIRRIENHALAAGEQPRRFNRGGIRNRVALADEAVDQLDSSEPSSLVLQSLLGRNS